MKAKDIIIKAIQREERALKISKPNEHLSAGHIQKADHNLIVMTDLNKLKHEDWVVVTAYYAMYQAASALLARIGLESKDHATTAAVMEYFFGELKELIGKFNELKERIDKVEAMTIGEKYIDLLWEIKRARETVQYGISIDYKETEAVIRNARLFVNKIKLVLNELDDKLIEVLGEEIKELEEVAY